MKRILITIPVLVVALAACGGSDDDGVASLSDAEPVVEDEASTEVDNEQAILAFAACMRENGVEDFVDPEFDGQGNVRFRFGGSEGAFDESQRETVEAAFEACRTELEGIAFGPDGIDLTEIEDTLVEFAECMRENGYDMPDPDLSLLAPGPGGEPGTAGPFGGEVDPDDPAFQEALEQCRALFETLPIGPGRGESP